MNHAVSQNEYICTNTTTTGSMASDSERIECPQCRIQREKNDFLKQEINKARRMMARSRQQQQQTEAMLAELVLKD